MTLPKYRKVSLSRCEYCQQELTGRFVVSYPGMEEEVRSSEPCPSCNRFLPRGFVHPENQLLSEDLID